MNFNSFDFLLFFPIIVIIYFLTKPRYRWFVLLAGSYYFYMSWNVEYILLIIISTLTDYYASLKLYNAKSKKSKRLYLSLSILINLGILFIFKYFNFFSESISYLFGLAGIEYITRYHSLTLPVGISFYTFQTMSYTIDVYRGKIKPERNLGLFSLYVSFFPQLVAGPIERAKNLLPQLKMNHSFDYKRITDGLKLILWGFFKKIVIADELAVIVTAVYSSPYDYTGSHFILATVFFAFQIYCDFSAYSDIAIGAAQILGISLMDNFNRPYFSKSVSEFWRRWHISLFNWFKDYVYIPLGGNRLGIRRTYLNLLIIFTLSGLWHGASWTFVIWGALNGIYIIIEKLSHGLRQKAARITGLSRYPRIMNLTGIAITFSLITFSWIFFRANSLSDALFIVGHLFTGLTYDISLPDIGRFEIIYCFMIIGFMEFVHLIQSHKSIRSFLSDKPIWVRWPIYITIIITILLFGIFNNTQFIYFQF